MSEEPRDHLGEEMAEDDNPMTWWLVNHQTDTPSGPFTTRADALLAMTIAMGMLGA